MSSVKFGPSKGTHGAEVRCLECLARINVAPKAKEVECPNCCTKYLIYWPTHDIAKIKGVVEERLP